MYHSQSFEINYALILIAVLGSLYAMSDFLFIILFKRFRKAEKMVGDLIQVSSAIIFFVPAFEIAFNGAKAPLPLVFSDILLIPIVPINAIIIILALIFKARVQSRVPQITVKINNKLNNLTKQPRKIVMLSEESEREQRKQETEKLMDWALQAIISWSVGLLTVFFGLMTLLVEIKLHGGIGTELTYILSIVYILLVLALGVSIIRIGNLYGELWQFQMSLPEEMRKRFGTQLYLNLIIDRKNNKVRTKTFPRFAFFFCVILILAWFL